MGSLFKKYSEIEVLQKNTGKHFFRKKHSPDN